MIRIERNPSRRQLFVFALAWLVLFAVLGGMAWRRSGSFGTAGVLWAVGAAIPAIGLACRGAMRIVYLLTCYATYPIGFVVSYVILAAVYYLVLTPTGLLLRLRGYDPMQRRFDQNAKSYWTPRASEDSAERYFKQF